MAEAGNNFFPKDDRHRFLNGPRRRDLADEATVGGVRTLLEHRQKLPALIILPR